MRCCCKGACCDGDGNDGVSVATMIAAAIVTTTTAEVALKGEADAVIVMTMMPLVLIETLVEPESSLETCEP